MNEKLKEGNEKQKKKDKRGENWKNILFFILTSCSSYGPSNYNWPLDKFENKLVLNS